MGDLAQYRNDRFWEQFEDGMQRPQQSRREPPARERGFVDPSEAASMQSGIQSSLKQEESPLHSQIPSYPSTGAQRVTPDVLRDRKAKQISKMSTERQAKHLSGVLEEQGMTEQDYFGLLPHERDDLLYNKIAKEDQARNERRETHERLMEDSPLTADVLSATAPLLRIPQAFINVAGAIPRTMSWVVDKLDGDGQSAVSYSLDRFADWITTENAVSAGIGRAIEYNQDYSAKRIEDYYKQESYMAAALYSTANSTVNFSAGFIGMMAYWKAVMATGGAIKLAGVKGGKGGMASFGDWVSRAGKPPTLYTGTGQAGLGKALQAATSGGMKKAIVQQQMKNAIYDGVKMSFWNYISSDEPDVALRARNAAGVIPYALTPYLAVKAGGPLRAIFVDNLLNASISTANGQYGQALEEARYLAEMAGDDPNNPLALAKHMASTSGMQVFLSDFIQTMGTYQKQQVTQSSKHIPKILENIERDRPEGELDKVSDQEILRQNLLEQGHIGGPEGGEQWTKGGLKGFLRDAKTGEFDDVERLQRAGGLEERQAERVEQAEIAKTEAAKQIRGSDVDKEVEVVAEARSKENLDETRKSLQGYLKPYLPEVKEGKENTAEDYIKAIDARNEELKDKGLESVGDWDQVKEHLGQWTKEGQEVLKTAEKEKKDISNTKNVRAFANAIAGVDGDKATLGDLPPNPRDSKPFVKIETAQNFLKRWLQSHMDHEDFAKVHHAYTKIGGEEKIEATRADMKTLNIAEESFEEAQRRIASEGTIGKGAYVQTKEGEDPYWKPKLTAKDIRDAKAFVAERDAEVAKESVDKGRTEEVYLRILRKDGYSDPPPNVEVITGATPGELILHVHKGNTMRPLKLNDASPSESWDQLIDRATKIMEKQVEAGLRAAKGVRPIELDDVQKVGKPAKEAEVKEPTGRPALIKSVGEKIPANVREQLKEDKFNPATLKTAQLEEIAKLENPTVEQIRGIVKEAEAPYVADVKETPAPAPDKADTVTPAQSAKALVDKQPEPYSSEKDTQVASSQKVKQLAKKILGIPGAHLSKSDSFTELMDYLEKWAGTKAIGVGKKGSPAGNKLTDKAVVDGVAKWITSKAGMDDISRTLGLSLARTQEFGKRYHMEADKLQGQKNNLRNHQKNKTWTPAARKLLALDLAEMFKGKHTVTAVSDDKLFVLRNSMVMVGKSLSKLSDQESLPPEVKAFINSNMFNRMIRLTAGVSGVTTGTRLGAVVHDGKLVEVDVPYANDAGRPDVVVRVDISPTSLLSVNLHRALEQVGVTIKEIIGGSVDRKMSEITRYVQPFTIMGYDKDGDFVYIKNTKDGRVEKRARTEVFSDERGDTPLERYLHAGSENLTVDVLSDGKLSVKASGQLKQLADVMTDIQKLRNWDVEGGKQPRLTKEEQAFLNNLYAKEDASNEVGTNLQKFYDDLKSNKRTLHDLAKLVKEQGKTLEEMTGAELESAITMAKDRKDVGAFLEERAKLQRKFQKAIGVPVSALDARERDIAGQMSIKSLRYFYGEEGVTGTRENKEIVLGEAEPIIRGIRSALGGSGILTDEKGNIVDKVFGKFQILNDNQAARKTANLAIRMSAENGAIVTLDGKEQSMTDALRYQILERLYEQSKHGTLEEALNNRRVLPKAFDGHLPRGVTERKLRDNLLIVKKVVPSSTDEMNAAKEYVDNAYKKVASGIVNTAEKELGRRGLINIQLDTIWKQEAQAQKKLEKWNGIHAMRKQALDADSKNADHRKRMLEADSERTKAQKKLDDLRVQADSVKKELVTSRGIWEANVELGKMTRVQLSEWLRKEGITRVASKTPLSKAKKAELLAEARRSLRSGKPTDDLAQKSYEPSVEEKIYRNALSDALDSAKRSDTAEKRIEKYLRKRYTDGYERDMQMLETKELPARFAHPLRWIHDSLNAYGQNLVENIDITRGHIRGIVSKLDPEGKYIPNHITIKDLEDAIEDFGYNVSHKDARMFLEVVHRVVVGGSRSHLAMGPEDLALVPPEGNVIPVTIPTEFKGTPLKTATQMKRDTGKKLKDARWGIEANEDAYSRLDISDIENRIQEAERQGVAGVRRSVNSSLDRIIETDSADVKEREVGHIERVLSSKQESPLDISLTDAKGPKQIVELYLDQVTRQFYEGAHNVSQQALGKIGYYIERLADDISQRGGTEQEFKALLEKTPVAQILGLAREIDRVDRLTLKYGVDENTGERILAGMVGSKLAPDSVEHREVTTRTLWGEESGVGDDSKEMIENRAVHERAALLWEQVKKGKVSDFSEQEIRDALRAAGVPEPSSRATKEELEKAAFSIVDTQLKQVAEVQKAKDSRERHLQERDIKSLSTADRKTFTAVAKLLGYKNLESFAKADDEIWIATELKTTNTNELNKMSPDERFDILTRLTETDRYPTSLKEGAQQATLDMFKQMQKNFKQLSKAEQIAYIVDFSLNKSPTFMAESSLRKMVDKSFGAFVNQMREDMKEIAVVKGNHSDFGVDDDKVPSLDDAVKFIPRKGLTAKEYNDVKEELSQTLVDRMNEIFAREDDGTLEAFDRLALEDVAEGHKSMEVDLDKKTGKITLKVNDKAVSVDDEGSMLILERYHTAYDEAWMGILNSLNANVRQGTITLSMRNILEADGDKIVKMAEDLEKVWKMPKSESPFRNQDDDKKPLLEENRSKFDKGELNELRARLAQWLAVENDATTFMQSDPVGRATSLRDATGTFRAAMLRSGAKELPAEEDGLLGKYLFDSGVVVGVRGYDGNREGGRTYFGDDYIEVGLNLRNMRITTSGHEIRHIAWRMLPDRAREALGKAFGLTGKDLEEAVLHRLDSEIVEGRHFGSPTSYLRTAWNSFLDIVRSLSHLDFSGARKAVLDGLDRAYAERLMGQLERHPDMFIRKLSRDALNNVRGEYRYQSGEGYAQGREIAMREVADIVAEQTKRSFTRTDTDVIGGRSTWGGIKTKLMNMATNMFAFTSDTFNSLRLVGGEKLMEIGETKRLGQADRVNATRVEKDAKIREIQKMAEGLKTRDRRVLETFGNEYDSKLHRTVPGKVQKFSVTNDEYLQVMSLYRGVLATNDPLLRAAMNRITTDAALAESKGKGVDRHINATMEDYERWYASATAQEKSLIEAGKEYYDVMYEHLNREYHRIHGRDLDKYIFYSHITRDMSLTGTEDGVREVIGKTKTGEAKALGEYIDLNHSLDPNKESILRDRAFRKEPIIIRGFFDNIEKYGSQVLRYIDSAEYQMWLRDSVINNPPVRQAIVDRYGGEEKDGLLTHFENRVESLGGVIDIRQQNIVYRGFSKVLRNSTTVRLASVAVPVKQVASVWNAITEFDTATFAGGLSWMFGGHGKEVKEVEDRNGWIYARRHAAGSYEANVPEERVIKTKGFDRGALRRAQDLSSSYVQNTLGWGDRRPIDAIIGMAYHEVQKQGQHKVGSDEFYRAVGDRAARVAMRTQVATNPMERSQMSIGSGPFDRVMGYLFSARERNLNMVYKSIIDMRRGLHGTPEEREQATVRAIKTGLGVMVLQAMSIAGINVMRDSMRRPQDFESDEEMDKFGKTLNALIASTLDTNIGNIPGADILGISSMMAQGSPFHTPQRKQLAIEWQGNHPAWSTFTYPPKAMASMKRSMKHLSDSKDLTQNHRQRRRSERLAAQNAERFLMEVSIFGSEILGIPVNQVMRTAQMTPLGRRDRE